ncbi:HNH endonuclease [Lachnoclostridium sp. Marseille-P6806]|uniref:HNH endonuclease n=1 Tax=Lachnoclostridium sp. Marseille-P6806 TaxID=2364793 RepID=UPI001F5F01CD|nr:HNH endonuclease [Lachnoclostridium sp. Marseille-P6806]
MKISEPNPNILHIEALRKKFVSDFDRDMLEGITLEQYAMRTGDKKNFCYRLEREQIGMGDIRNATAQKFGIWVRKSTGEYDFTKKYGQTAEEAFSVIRSELCRLVDAGKEDDFNAIRKNMLAPIVRYKILAMYYPDKFLTIHSERHLTYFCKKAGIPYLQDDDELVLQRKLLQWKENQPDIQNQSLLEYVAYLYEHFGVPPTVDKGLAKKKTRLKKLKDDLKAFDGRHVKTHMTEVEVKERSTLVAEIVKERAAGVCQLCNKPAPFFNKKGEAYLECHHVIWIARGGADEVYNAVALCPNCHRKMHILDEKSDVDYLMEIAKG